MAIFLPPIGGMISTQAYIWGDASKIEDEDVELTVRVHDECNGSDVFGSDICTQRGGRPYLTHAIEECIKTAQRGGTGVVVYFRKEGRALGEVTKYLVYNMRKRQEGGDKAKEYERGVTFNPSTPSTRLTASGISTALKVLPVFRTRASRPLMPDVLHWLGITKIHNFISMSDMKCVGPIVRRRSSSSCRHAPVDAPVQVQRHRRVRHQDREPRRDPAGDGSERCPGRDRGQGLPRLPRRRGLRGHGREALGWGRRPGVRAGPVGAARRLRPYPAARRAQGARLSIRIDLSMGVGFPLISGPSSGAPRPHATSRRR